MSIDTLERQQQQQQEGPRARRWTLDEYYRMGEIGLFQDQHVELIDGEVIQLSPQKDRHYASVALMQQVLNDIFRQEYWVRVQGPLNFGDKHEPEPDVSVVRGAPRDYIGTGHPKTALLVVEVSDTTLRYDQGEKASLYASRGIADYWIVNLPEQRLEVRRDPAADAEQRFGHRYGTLTVYERGRKVAPLATTDSPVAVADLLP